MRVFVVGYKGAGMGGRAIKWFTFGGFSHVSMVFDLGGGILEEIDALQGRGVTRRGFGSVSGELQIFEIECDKVSARRIYSAAIKLLGRKYDWAGIWGFLRRRKRQNPEKWFCSELVAHCLAAGGVETLRLPAWKISPVMLCASPVLLPVKTTEETNEKRTP